MSLPHAWHGDGAEPLVLIAGLGAKGTSWQPFLERAARSHRVLTFDNRGSGQAPPLDKDASVADLAGEALDLLDAQGVERAALVGRSMGGMIAQEMALRAPERVSKLVLVSTTGRADPHLAEVFLTWARLAEAGVAPDLRHRASLLWCLGSASLAADGGRDGPARRYLAARARTDRPLDYARQARACAQHDALDRLGALRCPTLVVAGDDDRLTPPHHADALAAAIPGSRRATIHGAGHLAYLEAPADFAAEVLGFLSQPGEAGDERSEEGDTRTCPGASTPW